jgi:hypothetical protein
VHFSSVRQISFIIEHYSLWSKGKNRFNLCTKVTSIQLMTTGGHFGGSEQFGQIQQVCKHCGCHVSRFTGSGVQSRFKNILRGSLSPLGFQGRAYM